MRRRELERRRRQLQRAYLIGLLSSRTYAWLWLSLNSRGRAWRWN